MDNDNLVEIFDNIFDKNSIEYKASKEMEELTKKIPKEDVVINYIETVAKCYKHYIKMVDAYENDDFDSVTAEAEIIIGTVAKFDMFNGDV